MRHLFILAIGFCLLISGVTFSAPSTQPAVPWAKDPPSKWPQMVLTNEASFNDHTPLQGASSFLMRMPDGSIAIGTAKHLIKSAGGVEPPLNLVDFEAALQDWRVFPRTQSNRAVNAKKLLVPSYGESAHDWLLLGLADPNARLPAEPLVPRDTPVEVGETIYLIGVPYSDERSPQNVYKGAVTARPMAHYFSYQFDPPVAISGFSGAPIVDSNGLLVGHGVSRQKLKQKDGLEIEFGGEDASLALNLWEHRNDVRIDVTAAIHLELPPGWVGRKSKMANIAKSAQLLDHDVLFDLFAWPRSVAEDEIKLKDWAEKNKRVNAASTKIDDRQETELQACTIAGREGYEYSVTGRHNNKVFRYRIVLLERSKCFCRLVFWGTTAEMDAVNDKCDEMLNAMR